jgi:hypothetical protein
LATTSPAAAQKRTARGSKKRAAPSAPAVYGARAASQAECIHAPMTNILDPVVMPPSTTPQQTANGNRLLRPSKHSGTGHRGLACVGNTRKCKNLVAGQSVESMHAL